ncbi:hypothetical protein HMPREF9069_01129 [Atopobium sp. oral taxon 810 str. F0209]|nr:hypothetical protein HMPREF9069_01129 [Atopobium sp. oral taxon 810 str. F0209]
MKQNVAFDKQGSAGWNDVWLLVRRAVQSEIERGVWQAGSCNLKQNVAFGKQSRAS